MFTIERPKILTANMPDEGVVVFETGLTSPHYACEIASSTFELWVWRGRHKGGGTFVATLAPDLRHPDKFPCLFDKGQRLQLRLVWHATPEGFQAIEDHRDGGDALLQIRVLLNVITHVRGNDGGTRPQRSSEGVLDESATHMLWAIPPSEWIAILNDVKFRHATLREWPARLHDSLKVPESHLSRAWDEHRAGKPDNALFHCFKALECLAFNVYGDHSMTREALIARLLDNASEKKQLRLVSMMTALTDFLHIGRHARNEHVPLDQKDSELALLATGVLLQYIGSRLS